jgi:hypothetical protein
LAWPSICRGDSSRESFSKADFHVDLSNDGVSEGVKLSTKAREHDTMNSGWNDALHDAVHDLSYPKSGHGHPPFIHISPDHSKHEYQF